MNLTAETQEELRRAGISTSFGAMKVDLQAPAKEVIPKVTPLLNKIPRTKGEGNVKTEWKTVTGINTLNLSPGVGEGQRNAMLTTSMVDKSAYYGTLGFDDAVTEEAVWAGKGFTNLPADVKRRIILGLKIAEERVIFGGRRSTGLGTTPTPTATTATTGGAIATGLARVVYIVALSHAGWQRSSVANGVKLTTTRSNMGGTTATDKGGHAAPSAASNSVTTGAGSANSISWSLTSGVLGAAAYAVFVGADAASARLYEISLKPSGIITSLPTTTQLLSVVEATDESADSLVFDGLASQLSASGFGGYQKQFLGTSLTSDGAAGIVELNDAFAWFWDNWKLAPSDIWCSAKMANAIDKIVIANGGAPIMRVNTAPGGSVEYGRGGRITSVLDKSMNVDVALNVHPDAPDSWIMFTSDSVPFPTANIGNPVEVHVQQEYYGRDWPMNNRQYEFGTYVREALPIYAEGAFGLIQGLIPA